MMQKNPELQKIFDKLCAPDGEPRERHQALSSLKDFLRVNPKDDVGMRYLLTQCLLETGFEEELGEILQLYPEDQAPEIRYTQALWTFRREGPSLQANFDLAEALTGNPYVPDYLLRRKALPKSPPPLVQPGAEDEAITYVLNSRESWQKTLGAIEWLAMNTSI